MFMFGDSLFDAGNNDFLNISIDYKADFPPYGETFFNFSTGRSCDGRILPDFAATYANLPLLLPYLYPGFNNFSNGVNFASAGAGVLPQTDPETVL
ncbi:hypothetical protein Pint_29356 [Pistacia integerrima]|uniref:Uncharacterized protein n=1 Tax=Pistacia integerrima TaxID=434235 RepID=A0ACC0WZV1_9ROSI|nr:hypothetical protein Pint_29356 [Pistacia integerrima]